MSTPVSYSFDEKLSASDGHCEQVDVSRILLSNIAGSLNVHRAHEQNDRSGVDWWVECVGCRHLAVDAKIREEDWALKGMDDLALEIWSVVEKQKVGWTLDENKRCDYVLWLWKETGRWSMVPFPMLCKTFKRNLDEWTHQFKVCRQHTPVSSGGYHSECVFVPRQEVWRGIYKMFGGHPII